MSGSRHALARAITRQAAQPGDVASLSRSATLCQAPHKTPNMLEHLDFPRSCAAARISTRARTRANTREHARTRLNAKTGGDPRSPHRLAARAVSAQRTTIAALSATQVYSIPADRCAASLSPMTTASTLTACLFHAPPYEGDSSCSWLTSTYLPTNWDPLYKALHTKYPQDCPSVL